MEASIRNMNRPQMYLFGCTLKSDRREFKVEVQDFDADHQLSLKAVCLGADAKDTFHTVEIEGATFDGKLTKVPLAILKPSVLPSMSLGGFEVTPPVTFRLQSGCGPVHISGQHFVSLRDSDDDEEEHNSSPVKRASSQSAGKRPAPKKLKVSRGDGEEGNEDDSEEDDDDDDDDGDDDDESEDGRPRVPKSPAKRLKKSPDLQKPRGTLKQNGSRGNPGGSGLKKDSKPGGGALGRAGAGPSRELSVAEVKTKLASAVKEGKPLPKTEQKFENYANCSFKISDKKVLKDLWNFVQTLKTVKK